MSKNDFAQPVIFFTRFTDDFVDVGWSMVMQGSFEVQQQLEAMLKEATAKGLELAVNVSLVPRERFMLPPSDLGEGDGDAVPVA